MCGVFPGDLALHRLSPLSLWRDSSPGQIAREESDYSHMTGMETEGQGEQLAFHSHSDDKERSRDVSTNVLRPRPGCSPPWHPFSCPSLPAGIPPVPPGWASGSTHKSHHHAALLPTLSEHSRGDSKDENTIRGTDALRMQGWGPSRENTWALQRRRGC